MKEIYIIEVIIYNISKIKFKILIIINNFLTL